MVKYLLIVASFLAVALARPEPPSYGVPSQDFGGGDSGGRVYKHVYVHAAPDEGTQTESRLIRVPGGGNKHVNIIFVKTPSTSSHQNTEVILPEQDEQKTVVYVLVKKGQHTSNVQLRQPAASAPAKPEVFFIRYKDAGGSSGGYPVGVAVSNPTYGAPVAVSQPSYGTPVAVSETYGLPGGGY